jgi:aryl-alcohol dehydrogenase-like predicted oxidoreductase
LRVSELALGTGNFGTGWGHGAEREEAKHIFDGYVEAGGNFIDTADTYQVGQSEDMVGDFIAADRDHFVVATKYSFGAQSNGGLSRSGNSRKNMVRSVEASLKRLKTDRIDLYWTHLPDGVTPIEEIVRAFDDLVRSGKILHAGLSNFPAWRVSQAATLAAMRVGRRLPESRWNTASPSARRNGSSCRWRKRWGWELHCGRRSVAAS